MMPHTVPRSHGPPRPVIEPSSDNASANPIEIPAPMEAAMPITNVSQLFCVAKAAAKTATSKPSKPAAATKAQSAQKAHATKPETHKAAAKKKADDVFAQAKAGVGNGKPKMILFKTEMGHGVDFMAGTHKWHGSVPSEEQCQNALSQLEETLGDF